MHDCISWTIRKIFKMQLRMNIQISKICKYSKCAKYAKHEKYANILNMQMQIYRTKSTRLILPNQIANPNLQNQIYQSNLPNQTCQRKLTKPNLPNKANMKLFLLTTKAVAAEVPRSVCLWQCLSFITAASC